MGHREGKVGNGRSWKKETWYKRRETGEDSKCKRRMGELSVGQKGEKAKECGEERWQRGSGC